MVGAGEALNIADLHKRSLSGSLATGNIPGELTSFITSGLTNRSTQAIAHQIANFSTVYTRVAYWRMRTGLGWYPKLLISRFIYISEEPRVSLTRSLDKRAQITSLSGPLV
jgi:hypothetical protein